MPSLRHKLADPEAAVPLHFEGVGVRPRLALLSWPLGVVSVIGGLMISANAAAPWLQIGAALFAVLGGFVLLWLIRCPRFEIIVTSRLLTTRLGPFKRRLPVAFIASINVQPASGWRKLYADSEVVLGLKIEERTVRLPSREPAELVSALTLSPEASR